MRNFIDIDGSIYTYESIKNLSYLQVKELIAMCDTIEQAKKVANTHSEEAIIYVHNLELNARSDA